MRKPDLQVGWPEWQEFQRLAVRRRPQTHARRTSWSPIMANTFESQTELYDMRKHTPHITCLQ